MRLYARPALMTGAMIVALPALLTLLAPPFAPALAGEAAPTVRPTLTPTSTDLSAAGWREMTFPGVERRTRYMSTVDEGVQAICAISKSSSSGLIRSERVNLKEFPFLSWSWKVTRVYQNADPSSPSGDDFPARLFVIFDKPPRGRSFFGSLKRSLVRLLPGSPPPEAALAYVWASRAPVGTVIPSPYTDRCRALVVESGSGHLGKWETLHRNIVADYRKVFGGDPPPVAGIAIMTDSDNTGESAMSFYGNIEFLHDGEGS